MDSAHFVLFFVAELLMAAVFSGALMHFAPVGIAEVIREAYPDPTAAPGEPWVWVDFAAVKPLARPVSLKEIKATPALSKMALVTCMRLSVQPVTEAEWALITKMSET